MDLLTEAEGAWADHLFACWEAGAWDSQPAEDRAYGHRHLAEHLDASSRPSARLYALVSVEWMRGRYALDGGYTGFLSDVDRAWARADRPIIDETRSPDTSADSPRERGSLVMQTKCALCHSSVVARASGMPPELFAPLLAHGILSFESAIGIAQRAAGRGRIPAWTALIPLIPSEHLESATREASRIEEPEHRAKVLCEMMPRLEPPVAVRAWHVALAAARQTGDSYARRTALEEVIQCAPPEAGDAALQTARGLPDHERGYAIGRLAERLPQSLLSDAAEMAMKVEDSASRFSALITIAERLPLKERRTVLAAARDTATRVPHVNLWPRMLARLLPLLSPAVVRRTLAKFLARATELDSSDQEQAVRVLAPLLSAEALDRAFDLATAIESPRYRALAVSALAAHHPVVLHRRALELIERLADQKARAEGFASLAANGRAKDARRLLGRALVTSCAIASEPDRRHVFRDALGGPTKAPSRAAIRAARSFVDPRFRSEALALVLARSWRDRAVELEAFECARTIREPAARAESMIELIPNLSKDLQDSALDDAIRTLPSLDDKTSNARDRAFYLLAQCAPPERLLRLLSRATDLLGSHGAASAVCAGAARLPRTSIARAVRIAERITNPGQRGLALGALAARLDGAAATSLYQRAFGATTEIADATARAALSRRLAVPAAPAPAAPDTPISVSEDAAVRAAARERYQFLLHDPSALDDHLGWIQKMLDLMPALPAEMRAEATRNVDGFILAAALDRADRSRALIGLAPFVGYLDERRARRVLNDALEAASTLSEPRRQAHALMELVPYMPEKERPRTVVLALDAARYTAHEEDRPPVLKGLAPYLSGAQLRQAIADTLNLDHGSLRAEALTALANRLVEVAALDPAAAHDGWTFALHRLAGFARGEAVDALAELACVAVALGRESVESDVASALSKALDQLAEWWP